MSTMTMSAASKPMSKDTAQDWLVAFNRHMGNAEYDQAAALFRPDGYWRDQLGFSWDLQTSQGRSSIATRLADLLPGLGTVHLQLDEQTAELGQLGSFGETLNVFICFRTRFGRGRGVLRLVVDDHRPGSYLALTLLTRLDELTGHPERTGRARPRNDARVLRRDADN